MMNSRSLYAAEESHVSLGAAQVFAETTAHPQESNPTIMFLNPFQKTKLIPNNAPRNINSLSFDQIQNSLISFCSSRL